MTTAIQSQNSPISSRGLVYSLTCVLTRSGPVTAIVSSPGVLDAISIEAGGQSLTSKTHVLGRLPKLQQDEAKGNMQGKTE